MHWEELTYPAYMMVDYVRLYQRPGQTRVSCDPADHPTKAFIDAHPEPYHNPNLTTWPKDIYPWPKNRLMEAC